MGLFERSSPSDAVTLGNKARLRPPTCSVSLHGVPDVAVKVVITSQQQTAGAREGHRRDAADDVVVAIEAELLVRTQVEQPAGGVVGACGEGAAVGKELRRGTGISVDTSRGWRKTGDIIARSCPAFGSA